MRPPRIEDKRGAGQEKEKALGLTMTDKLRRAQNLVPHGSIMSIVASAALTVEFLNSRHLPWTGRSFPSLSKHGGSNLSLFPVLFRTRKPRRKKKVQISALFRTLHRHSKIQGEILSAPLRPQNRTQAAV